ncbi:MAG: SPFH domain-containing protein [Phycisphaerales bacterium]|jgi:regulator of protease activity HflC (stomatin/prohibitin superfamily)|nr:SPFH domain-containing protein [Phycisphaerales bacterium]
MRVDHLAYQRATNIAGLGFLLQAALGTVLLVLGLSLGDTGSVIASIWMLLALVVWLGLLVIFNQHRLERIESLETDELLQVSGETSLFEGAAGGVAARRLRMLYRWFLPGLSIALAIGLVVGGWMVVSFMGRLTTGEVPSEFLMSEHRGWIVAIDLSFAVIAFIFSRFLAGMAEFSAWRNLRAGAGVMVGNALICLAIAVGVVFRFFDLPMVVQGVSWGIAIFMFIIAAEVLLAIVLNAYRPRVAGEFPRAGFDSRSLSLLSRPDSFVKTLNEAVNYQFGFDITSSWGYQLVLRSGVWLAALSIISLLAMSMFVVVDGRQEGLRLRSGRIVPVGEREVQPPGAFWKLPWPLEYAELHDISELRSLPVTPPEAGRTDYDNWTKPSRLANKAKEVMFIVRPSSLGEAAARSLIMDLGDADDDVISEGRWSLVGARFSLLWRVRGGAAADDDGGGLLQYLKFGTDQKARRRQFTDREQILRGISLAEATRLFATLGIDDLLTTRRGEIGEMLASGIQKRLDSLEAGIEVVSVDIPIIAPPEDTARAFEDLPVAIQQADRAVANAERKESSTLTQAVGNPKYVEEAVAAVDRVNALRAALGAASETNRPAAQAELDAAVAEAEKIVRKGGGGGYQILAAAERDRWIELLARQGQATRVRGQEASWKAAPELFRQRAIMKLYAQHLPTMRKYVMGIDPEHMDLNLELRELASPNTVFSESLVGGDEEEE